MAITALAIPQTITPAYNPVKLIVDSTNKNNVGFKYIFKVEDALSNQIADYRILPSYSTGYGEQDLSKLLSSYVTFDLNTKVTTPYGANDSYFYYTVTVGEEYTAQYNYTASLTNDSGNVKITVTNTFVAGDRINITQDDGGVANPYLEGLFTVVSATSTYVVINSLYSLVTDVTINGSITYADNRKKVDLNLYNASLYVYNGAIRWNEFLAYDYNNFSIGNVNNLWLTNQPTTFYATLGQDMYLNSPFKFSFTTTHYVIFKNSNGEYFYKTVSGINIIDQIPCGANNYGVLTPIGSATLPMIKTDTTSYQFYYASTNSGIPTPISQTYTINLDTRVQISEYHCLFLDRQGSFNSFAFQLKNYERGEIQREEFNQDVTGFIDSLKWSYDTIENGFKSFNINVKKTIDLNTNWMSESMGRYFEELITSPQVYLKLASYTNTESWLYPEDESGCPLRIPESTEYQPVIVTNNSYEVYQQRNSNLIKQSITVRLANQDNING